MTTRALVPLLCTIIAPPLLFRGWEGCETGAGVVERSGALALADEEGGVGLCSAFGFAAFGAYPC